jgi:hypothetical protein
MNPLIPRFRKVTLPYFIVLAFGYLAFLPNAPAISPPPDGGYPGGNTAEGQNALHGLTTGGFNTAVGIFSLFTDITGSFNTAVGAGALLATTADGNTATGATALLSNGTGANNTATGVGALSNNTSGNANTAYGSAALGNNTTGNVNIGLGEGAGTNVITANGVICIGAAGADTSNTTWISNVYGATTQVARPCRSSCLTAANWAQSSPPSGSRKTLPAWRKPVKQFCHSDQSHSTTRRTPKAPRNLAC